MTSPAEPEATHLRVRHQGTDWRVRREWQDRLFGGDAPDWLCPAPHDDLELVKAGHQREVFRASIAGTHVFAKVFHVTGLVGRVKDLVHRHPAEIEWNRLCAAEQLVQPPVTPLPIGIGKTTTPTARARYILLTAAAPGEHRLETLLLKDRLGTASDLGACKAQRRRYLDAVARLLAVTHESGLLHRDGHPGNILIGVSDAAQPAAWYVDCYALCVYSAPVPAMRRLRSVAQLDMYLRYVCSRTERLRMLHAYNRHCKHFGALAQRIPTSGPVLQRIMAIQHGMSRRLARARDRRLRRHGPYFHAIRSRAGWQGTVVLKLARRQRFSERNQPDRRSEDWDRLLQSISLATLDERAFVGGERLYIGGNVDMVIRRPSSLWQGFWWRLVGSAAQTKFERCHRRRHRDLEADLVLGFLELRGRICVRCAVMFLPAQLGNADPSAAAGEDRKRVATQTVENLK